MTKARHAIRRYRRRPALPLALIIALVAVIPQVASAAPAGIAEATSLPVAGPGAKTATAAAAPSVSASNAGAAIVRVPTGGYWMFAVQANGHIFQMVKGSGDWTAPNDLGGPFRTGPAATYLADGNQIDLFAVGTDGYLKQSIFRSGRWSPWVRIMSGFSGGLSAIRLPGGEMHVFGVGSDSRAKHAVRIGGHWRLGDLGGNIRASTAATYDPGRRSFDLFAVGTDGRVRHRHYEHGGWTGWSAATVGKGYAGVAAMRVDRFQRIYVVHTNGTIGEFHRDAGRWSTPWVMGDKLVGTPAATVTPREFRVLANRNDGRLVENVWNKSWSGWKEIPRAGARFPKDTPPVAGRVALAKQLLARWGGRLTGLPGVKADLQATVDGRAIRNSDSCGRSVHLDAAMLRTIVAATDRYQVFVNNMVTGHGCDSGMHPKGKAVDFNTVVDPRTGRSTNWHSGTSRDNIGLDVEFLTHVASVVTDGGGAGQRYCAGRSGARLPAGMVWFDDYCNHQHLDVR